MPAVQIPRLKAQISQLIWRFTRPEEFRAELKQLFELYADRTYRPGQTVQALKHAPAYHVPILVMRQLELDLAAPCQENPEAALSVADSIWAEEYLELRQVAAFLLGQVPLDPPERILERLRSWCQPAENRLVLEAALQSGSYRLRKEQPARWLALAGEWLWDQSSPYRSMGLKALLPLVKDRQNQNLPPIFQMIGPLVQSPTTALQSDLAEVLEELAKRSPVETAYFLRQILSLSQHPETLRLVRRTLPALTPQAQASLRSAMKNT
ncbi:MAG: DNA alkylation repair protein [Anaerolineaceae bacterium]|nr:DNA alkylation repair protein [Anaerolineaceae bacterium]